MRIVRRRCGRVNRAKGWIAGDDWHDRLEHFLEALGPATFVDDQVARLTDRIRREGDDLGPRIDAVCVVEPELQPGGFVEFGEIIRAQAGKLAAFVVGQLEESATL